MVNEESDKAEVTTSSALKFYIQHSDKIDTANLVRSFAVAEPTAFCSFIAELTGLSFNGIATALIKSDPRTFMKLASSSTRLKDAVRQIYQLTAAGNRVEAIKLIRATETSFGLKEAKEIHDAYVIECLAAGRNEQWKFWTGSPPAMPLLNDEQQQFLALLLLELNT